MNAPNLPIQPLNDNEIANLLSKLPQFNRNPKAEAVFYKKLQALARPSRQLFVWPRFAFASGFLAIFLFSIITFASYRPSVTYGSSLYQWKKTAEKVELAFVFSPVSKIDAHLKISDRRLDEAEQILKASGKIGWIIPKVSADFESNSLNPDENRNLELTLDDMHAEVAKASDIAESTEFEPAEAERILSKIENTSSKHVERLVSLANKSRNGAVAIIQRSADNEDNRVALVVETKERVRQAIAANQKKIKVQFKKRQEKLDQRLEQATEEFKQTNDLFVKLPEVQKVLFNEKFQTAEEALKSGNLGKAKGLSRALQAQMESLRSQKLGTSSIQSIKKTEKKQKNTLKNENSEKKQEDKQP